MKTPGGPWNKLRMRATITLMLLAQPTWALHAQQASSLSLLHPESFRHYFIGFERDEKEMLGEAPPVPWDWFAQNIPLLDVPDKELEEIYYFRWFAFQKHIVHTPDGFLISEFLDNVPWAGKFNTIDAAAGHQLREARWLRNPVYVEDYAKFWFGPDGEPRRYSFWAADSIYQVYLSTGDKQLAVGLLPALEKNYQAWEVTHQDANGLFWQIDDRDGMEFTIGGSGYRPTINSYMYGDAEAISHIAQMAGQTQISEEYQTKAEDLRKLIDDRLWNAHDEFYETVPRNAASGWSDVRELVGYIPWYFNIPSAKHDVAWKFLFDPEGFAGQYGPTTAERRSPRFRYAVHHECLWNGPSWPFATTQTLVAMANVLNGPEQSQVSSSGYYRLLSIYAHSQHIRLPDGRSIPWIDEDLDADTGEWIARNILISLNQPPKNRGRYYNHSGFADLTITGLIGLRPSSGNQGFIHPLVPQGTWKYFALDGVPYHGHLLTILYDRDGSRYHRGVGLRVLCDGRVVAHSATLQPLHFLLSSYTGLQETGASISLKSSRKASH
jgi:hypothetical protein